MARPNISVLDHAAGVRLVKFEIPGGVTSPAEFAEATAEVASQLPGDKPVLVNGRGPVWGYGMLLHAAHPTPACATYDPRLGYVVVATHNEQHVVGQVIPDPEA
ncbi:MAG: CRISPR-associated ring nuclease Crn3/Csx3 [bacterium]|nr:CRISPR-associated ring nuclease Crn3/Csx3 [bacterium]